MHDFLFFPQKICFCKKKKTPMIIGKIFNINFPLKLTKVMFVHQCYEHAPNSTYNFKFGHHAINNVIFLYALP